MDNNANLDAPVPQPILDAACSDGREWAEGRTLREVWRECPHPDWLLWLAGRLDSGTVEALETECPRLDRCAKECPDYALEYAAGLLTPERLDRCAVEWPDYALEYAAHLLTPERLDWCAVKRPDYALEYAADLLTAKRMAWCAVKRPGFALRYAADLLTPERLKGLAAPRTNSRTSAWIGPGKRCE